MSTYQTLYTQLARDVRAHCRECMGGQNGATCNTISCALRKWSHVPQQVDASDGLVRENWIREAVNTCVERHASGAWWSELRRAIEGRIGAPWHPSWWGGVASGLRKARWSQAERRTCTELAQRNKAVEWYWSADINRAEAV